MLRNYFLIAIRSIIKNRAHTIINVLGLALGVTCSIVIFLILRFELSYDNFHPEGDRTYRIVTEYNKTEKLGYSSGMTYPLPDALRQDFAELEYVALVDGNLYDPVVAITRQGGTVDRFKESKVVFTDPEYLKMFHHEWIEGGANALDREKTVVLTESVAKKYFGDESPLNKVIHFNNEYDLTVTGVVKDPPPNTDFPFRIIISIRLGKDKRGWDGWAATSSSINCYVRLNKTISEEEFESKLKGWHLKYFTGDNKEDGIYRRYLLQPLSEIHFDTRFNNFGERVVSTVTLWSLGIIGVLLLLTACINFVNLNTVLIIKRSREAGVRKTLGSTHGQLILQFMGETFIISVLALLISAGLSEVLLINLQPILGYRLSFFGMLDGMTVAFLTLLPFLVTIVAGFYPAIRLSRFQPAKTLKAGLSSTYGQGLTLRRSLIVFQLFIAQALIITTIIIVQQTNHFMAQPLGLDSKAVVEFLLPENKAELIHTLKERLLNVAGVESVSMSNTGSTSQNQWGGDFEATIKSDLVKEYTNVKYADEDYIKTYGLTLLHGENLLRSDTANRFVINEKFAKAMGFQDSEDAIGTPINMWGSKALVTGIIKDFNASPLHNELSPVILLANTSAYYVGAVKINTKDTPQLISKIRDVWESVYPNYIFEHTFLDDQIANFYTGERKNAYTLGFFSMIAIFIGCIGLFGLVSFMVQQKVKEIGIRKTFGATVLQIVSILSKEFLLLVGISFVLATPLAFYFMQKWLDNFAYKYSMTGLEFAAGLVVTLLISMLTVGYRSVQAARANPVDALRTE